MRLQLIERREETQGVETYIFKPQEELSWKPGQFLHYVLHHRPTDERGSDRWFTVASSPSEGHVQLTTRFTHDAGSTFKKALAALKAGEIVEIADVDGDFTVDDPSREMIFIAGGIGITPFRAILKEADTKGVKLNVTLIYGSRDTNIVFKDELESFAKKNPGIKIHYLISPEKIDEASVRKLVPDLTKPVFYVSGPEPMVESLNATLKSMGVPQEHLKGDWFPGYEAE